MPFLAPLWLPFGLLDRQTLSPPRISDTIEINGGPAVTSTLHAQMSTQCDCHIGAYGTLPLAISVSEDPGVAAAGQAIPSDDSRVSIGTSEVGIFGGSERGRDQMIYRLGVLLPSASREQAPLPVSARVGDAVLELPRTMGVRMSHSQIWIKDAPWTSVAKHIMRLDVGLDVAGEYATEDHRRIVHMIPRIGTGVMQQCDLGSVSFETALSYDPFVEDGGLRWSAGITGMLKSRWLQPAATLAAIRTPDGWGATLSLDLAATLQPRYAEGL
ncbi:MAG TPA: hypothetical protein VMZ53_16600 [Kofleriaceae bacterium]|nr:hypothetical protein [Kofleriaceae bacterium]